MTPRYAIAIIVAGALAAWLVGQSISSLPLQLTGSILLAAGPALWFIHRQAVLHQQKWESLCLGLDALVEGDSTHFVSPTDTETGPILTRLHMLVQQHDAQRLSLYHKQLLLSALVDSVPVALLLMDSSGVIMHTSRHARDLLFQGRRVEDEPLTRAMDQVPMALLPLFTISGDSLVGLEVEGRLETYQVSKQYFELEGGRHSLLIFQSMTRELDRQERQIWKQVIRVINHELNNSVAPISSLVDSAQLIIENPALHARLPSTLEAIRECTSRLAQFLAGYAALARLPRPQQSWVEWKEFFEGIQALTPFRWEGPPPDGKGWFDPVQLQQVLVNLIKNSVEAGGPRDEICIEVTPLADGGARILVKDRGQGMSPELMHKALLPYFTTKKTGSGLGLPLCREILEGHDGSLHLQARAGGGLCVVCTLPSRAGRGGGELSPVDSSPSVRGGG